MAECIRYVCGNCSNEIEAWDCGNPYFFDSDGKKQYAYHPEKDFDRCVGNDSPRLCLECGTETLVDSGKLKSKKAGPKCGQCGSGNIVHPFQLAGHRCHVCKLGVFTRDPDFFCIS